MQRLFENVFILEGEVGGRPLQLTYLKGTLVSILLDTGCAHDPTRFIAPQIKEAGGNPEQLTWLINTHPDIDHTGGNYEMKKLAPKAILACGDADQKLCESFDDLFRYRYDAYREDHQIFYEGETLKWLREEGGKKQPIELTFLGGEHILLSDDWKVEILATPGHARGHIAILDPIHEAMYGGDAI